MPSLKDTKEPKIQEPKIKNQNETIPLPVKAKRLKNISQFIEN